MATFFLCPLASFLQVFTDAGVPLGGALLWTYAAGTSTPTNTWTDITGVTPNANPIQMNAAGRLPNVSIWQQGGVPIKLVFSTNAGTTGAPIFGTQIGPTFDQVSGIDDPAATLTALSTPTYGSGADLVANAMRSYDLISIVRQSNVPNLGTGQTLIIDVEGGSQVNDGLGGMFYWNASSTAADDNGFTTIKPNAAGSTGRYIRLTSSAGTNGTFTMVVTGCNTAPSVTFRYNLQGGPANGLVTLSWDGTGVLTSNSTSFGFSGMANGLQGLTKSVTSPLIAAEDNGAAGVAAYLTIQNQVGGSAVSITPNNASGLWTASGSKQLFPGSFSYVLK